MRTEFAELQAEQQLLTEWLFSEALPIWSDRGVDRKCGGFYEELAQDGAAIDGPRRTRLVSRQIYVFATAIELGWDQVDTARDLVGHGLDFLLDKCLSGQGTFFSVVDPAGKPVEPRFDLYDHAFALFALGTAARLDHRRGLAIDVGRRVRDAMIGGWKHPIAGFEESMPATEPLNANQHMHLLESFLEWEEAGEVQGWQELSDEIAMLALEFFIDPDTGGIREHYGHDWRPAAGDVGRLLEPGHQSEWSWLLWRWSRARERVDVRAKVLRLAEIAELHGVSPVTGLAINGIWDDLSVRDTDSRLWPQTERIKAHIAAADLSRDADGAQAVRRAAAAARGLRRYFETDIVGLWHETLDSQGRPVPASARASSLYHIVGAIRELDRIVRERNS